MRRRCNCCQAPRLVTLSVYRGQAGGKLKNFSSEDLPEQSLACMLYVIWLLTIDKHDKIRLRTSQVTIAWRRSLTGVTRHSFLVQNQDVARLHFPVLLSWTKTHFITAIVRKDEYVFNLAKKIWEEPPPSYQPKFEWSDFKLFKACFRFFSS